MSLFPKKKPCFRHSHFMFQGRGHFQDAFLDPNVHQDTVVVPRLPSGFRYTFILAAGGRESTFRRFIRESIAEMNHSSEEERLLL